MKTSRIRLLSLLLCLSMVIGMSPMFQLTASAAAVTHEAHGKHSEDDGWTPLAGEIASIPAGNVYLTGNVHLTGTHELVSDTHLCLNGYTITGSVAPYINMKDGAGATLILCDCSAEGKGKIDGSGLQNSAAMGLIAIRNLDTMIMYGGAITGHVTTGSYGGGIHINSGATFEMYGGSITKNQAVNGGAIGVYGYAARVTNVLINGGTISENTATDHGGAIYTTHGGTWAEPGVTDLKITGGEITDNTAKKIAGGVFANGVHCPLSISDGLISNNKGGATSTAVRVANGAFTMTGGIIQSVESSLPAVSVGGATATIDISGTAQIDKGAISFSGIKSNSIGNLEYGANVQSTVEMNADADDASTLKTYDEGTKRYVYTSTEPVPVVCCNTHDKTHGDGWTALSGKITALSGNVYLSADATVGAKINITKDTHLCLNGKTITVANVSNYVLYIDSGATLTLCDCAGGGKITGPENTKTANHGLIGVNNGTLDMYGGALTDHATSNNGGGVRVNGSGVFNMYGGEISNNSGTSGGGVFVSGGDFTMYGGQIYGNTGTNGGAIYCASSADVKIVDGKIYGNTSVQHGGAVYANTGTLTIEGGKIYGNETKLDNNSGAIRGQKVAFTMTGGAIENNTGVEGKSDCAVFLVTEGTTCAISGTAKIDEGGIKLYSNLPTGTIKNLQKGASVYAYNELSIADGTVSKSGEEAPFHYTYQETNSYGVTIGAEGASGDLLKVAESAIGSKAQLTVTYDEGVTPVEGGTMVWSSDNEAVASVDEDGQVTYVGYGSATVTVIIKDAQGAVTGYRDTITVQVGDDPLKVLSIGNSFSRDSMYYLTKLANLTGNRVLAAYLQKDSGTIRDHAYNLATNTVDYAYNKADVTTGEMVYNSKTTIQQALEDEDWDIIILHQGVNAVGWTYTYNSDLEYMIDYIQAEVPEADIYWNMTWALRDGLSGTSIIPDDFQSTFGGDQAVMYNAIVDCLDDYIVGSDSRFGTDIEAYFPTGAAIQNLRATYSGDLTRDGYHLSLEAGRLTAAMTLLKTLFPEADLDKITVAGLSSILSEKDEGINATNFTDPYENTEANLTLVKAAVTAACDTAKQGKVPAKLDVEPEETSANADVTVGQSQIPLDLHFPDTATLNDGTLISCAYENVKHAVTVGQGNLQEGSGRVVVWSGSADGKAWNYDEPLLVIDEEQLEEWGIITGDGIAFSVSNRYKKLKNDPNGIYYVMGESRDPNLVNVDIDMDGDGTKEDVLILTFWVRHIYNDGTLKRTTYLMHSTDGGQNWTEPQPVLRNESVANSSVTKRGDITVFADGNILVPYYGYGVGCLELSWNNTTKHWDMVADNEIPNTSDEGAEFNEISLVSPDGSNTVYAFIRSSGAVLVSLERGETGTWKEIGNEPGRIHQPGFTILDENHVFVTWAREQHPRTIYGKVFNINGEWSDTPTVEIYASPDTSNHDMGDPSCTLMADGKVFVVGYDVSYHSVIGMIVDPNSEAYQPIELTASEGNTVFEENFEDETAGSAYANDAVETTTDKVADGGDGKVLELTESGLMLKQPADGAHTVKTEVLFTNANGFVTIDTVVGSVNVTAAELELNTKTDIKVSVVGNDIYTKVWQGETEPASWNAVTTGNGGTRTGISGSSAKLDAITVSSKVAIILQETLSGVAKDPDVQLEYIVMPEQPATFTSSDETIVKVDENGVVSFISVGTATITMKVGNVTRTCTVTVEPQPAEITGAGEKSTILFDDYQKYAEGTDALWNYIWDSNVPEEDKLYLFNIAQSAKSEAIKYNIVKNGDNQYLELKGNSTWHMADIDLVGNYTVEFDFMFVPVDNKNETVNITMWQTTNDMTTEYGSNNQVHCFVNLTKAGYKINYREKSPWVDATTDQMYYPSSSNDQGDYDGTKWCTMKMTRIDGAFYVKVWEKGTEEPDWTTVLTHDVLDTDVVSNLRFQFVGNQGGSFMVDNLSITQQVESSVEATRMELANSLNMQFAVPMDQQESWTGAYAEVVYGNETTTVPFEKWLTLSDDNLYVVPFEGVAAKEMTEVVTVTIFDKDNNQIGASYTDSVRDYAMRILADEAEQAAWPMMVDMLNYGAAAQTYFQHNEDNLANKDLTQEQKDLATEELAAIENVRDTSDPDKELYKGTRLNLESDLGFQMAFDLNGYDLNDVKVSYSFENHYGKQQSGELTNGYTMTDTGWYLITVDAVVLADARKDVTVTVRCDGNTLITVTDSIAGYVARINVDDTVEHATELRELCRKLMLFADSSHTYLHRTDATEN